MYEKRESSTLCEPLKNESEITLHHQLVQYCSLLPDNLSKEEKERRQVVLWAIGERFEITERMKLALIQKERVNLCLSQLLKAMRN